MSNLWAAWLAEHAAQPFVLSRKAAWDAFVNTAARPPFTVLSRAEIARLGEEERADYDEARMVWHANLPTIRTQQLAQAYSVIDQVMASARRDGDRLRGAVAIDAAPNLGKTTIATRYARDYTAGCTGGPAHGPPRVTSGYRWRSCRWPPGTR